MTSLNTTTSLVGVLWRFVIGYRVVAGVTFAATIAGAAFALLSYSPFASELPDPDEPFIIEVKPGKSVERTFLDGKANLRIGPDAVFQRQILEVDPDSALSALPIGFKAISRGFRISPVGGSGLPGKNFCFESLVFLDYSLSASDVEVARYVESNLVIMHRRDVDDKWTELPTKTEFDPSSKSTGTVHCLCLFVVAVRTNPPEAGSTTELLPPTPESDPTPAPPTVAPKPTPAMSTPVPTPTVNAAPPKVIPPETSAPTAVPTPTSVPSSTPPHPDCRRIDPQESSGPDQALPNPYVFVGSVTVGGRTAAEGTEISALIAGIEVASTPVENGRYNIVITRTAASDTNEVSFGIGEYAAANEPIRLTPGEGYILDLFRPNCDPNE